MVSSSVCDRTGTPAVWTSPTTSLIHDGIWLPLKGHVMRSFMIAALSHIMIGKWTSPSLISANQTIPHTNGPLFLNKKDVFPGISYMDFHYKGNGNTYTGKTLSLFWNGPLGLHSLSGRTSYRKFSWSLGAARFGFRLFQSLWNLTSI